MKRRIVSMAFLTGVLFMCVACSANASTPELPPENNVEVEETVKTEPLAQSNEELPEISLEELEAIFEDVYTAASGNHPEDWSVDFQITDEIGKINKAIPDDKKAPSDLRVIYIEWRTERTAPEPAEEMPEEKPVTQQPTQSNNTTTISQGSSATQSDTGGSSDDWRQNMLTDLPNYGDATGGSYNDPDAQTSLIGSSSDSTTSASTSSDSGGTTAQYGFTVPAGYHVEVGDNGGYFLVNDETGHSRKLSGDKMDGYVAGSGQIEGAYEGNTGLELNG